MYKTIAILSLVIVASMSAPASEIDVESELDAIFGPKQPSSTEKAKDETDLDSMIGDIFGLRTTSSGGNLPSSTEGYPSEEGKECTKSGKKGTCIAYYKCTEQSDPVAEDIVLNDEDESCPNYFHVCCVSPPASLEGIVDIHSK